MGAVAAQAQAIAACEQLGKLGAETRKWQSELVRRAITQYLGKTKPETVEKISRRVAQMEKQVRR